jgi:hypothetical protein
MKTQNLFQEPVSSIGPLIKTARVLQLIVLALAMVSLLPSLALADDTDEGRVSNVDPGKDTMGPVAPKTDWTTKNFHLYKRPDGTYYMKSADGKVKMDITGATVTTPNGNFNTSATNNQQVNNFHNNVNSFIATAVASSTANSPASGASFFPLNLSTTLATEGDNSGMWEDNFTKTHGVVGFEMTASKMSLLGSSTSDGNTPIVYSFDVSMQTWNLDVTGANDFTFVDGGAGSQYSGGDFTEGWVIGATPEPSSLFLLGSGVLGLSGLLRKRLLT